MSVIVANRLNITDGSAYNMLAQVNSKLPIVLISRPDKFEFNDTLLGVKDYVLADFIEYGWNREFENTHLFGFNTDEFSDLFQGDEWHKFEDWVFNNPPKLYLKRELLKKDKTKLVQPIEYAGMYDIPPIQNKEEFDARGIEAFFSWGLSSEYRKWLHADIWRKSSDYGYAVCDNLHYLDLFIQNESAKKWLTVNVPHYCRYDMTSILSINGMAKISVSMPGAGCKCFRHAESPINAVMAKVRDTLSWTFEWNDANCIQFKLFEGVETIQSSLGRGDLYDIYVNGVETARKYLLPNYISHLEKLINERV